MIRRLQQTGRLYFVTLPTEWVLNNRLKKGFELDCELSKDSVTYSAKKIEEHVLEIEIKNKSIEGIVHLVIGAFESGASEITIKLVNELNKDEIDQIRDILFNNYSLTMVDVSKNKIQVSLFMQVSTINNTFKTMLNSVINICRAAVLKEDDLMKTHERQVQFFRFTMKRLVLILKELPSWSLIAESLGLISRSVFDEYLNKEYDIFFSKLLEILQKIMKNYGDLNNVVLLHEELPILKKMAYMKNEERQFNLDRCYRGVVNIIRELIKINISKAIS